MPVSICAVSPPPANTATSGLDPLLLLYVMPYNAIYPSNEKQTCLSCRSFTHIVTFILSHLLPSLSFSPFPLLFSTLLFIPPFQTHHLLQARHRLQLPRPRLPRSRQNLLRLLHHERKTKHPNRHLPHLHLQLVHPQKPRRPPKPPQMDNR